MPKLTGLLKHAFFNSDVLTVYVEFETSRGTLIKHTINCGNRLVFRRIQSAMKGMTTNVVISVSLGRGDPKVAVVSEN